MRHLISVALVVTLGSALGFTAAFASSAAQVTVPANQRTTDTGVLITAGT